MNVVFAADKNYMPHLAVAVLSLVRCNPDSALDIYVINTDIPSSELDKLRSVVVSGRHIIFDVKITDDELNGLVLTNHFAKANYYRLFAADKISGDRALYIDSDVLVVGAIDELYMVDIGSSYLGAVEESWFERHQELEMNPNSGYFNSGVMLLNIDAWRRDSIKDKVIDFVKRKPSVIKFVDQCGVNAVVNGAWVRLHPRYNLQSVFLDDNERHSHGCAHDAQIDEAIQTPVIVHFTGSSKPWHTNNSHPYRRLYWKYRNQSPYASLVADDFGMRTLIKRLLPRRMLDILRNLW